jgi:hypothetical protein
LWILFHVYFGRKTIEYPKWSASPLRPAGPESVWQLASTPKVPVLIPGITLSRRHCFVLRNPVRARAVCDALSDSEYGGRTRLHVIPSQKTCHWYCPEPDESSSYHSVIFFKMCFSIILEWTPFPSYFPPKLRMSFCFLPCVLHAQTHVVLLDLFIRPEVYIVNAFILQL